MRTLVIALILFVSIHIIRMDFTEGTIPLASFFQNEIPCSDPEVEVIQVTTITGDTVESLFSMYPDPESTFVERLSTFYSLNPHLRNQDIIGGLSIRLPLTKQLENVCK